MRGFSLLETVISTLLMVLMLSFVSMLSFSIDSEKVSALERMAAHTAVALLDGSRQIDPTTLPMGTWDGSRGDKATSLGNGVVFPPTPYPSAIVSFSVGGATVQQPVSFLVTAAAGLDRDNVTPLPDLVTVTCVATWQNGPTIRHLSFATGMSGGGL